MSITRLFIGLWFAFAGCPAAHAADYPVRHVTLITSSPAGGGPDVIARIVAEQLSRLWAQQVLVDNRPGGRGIVATLALKQAPRDGYTLSVTLGSTYVVLPVIQPKLPFDLQHDIVPIGLVGEQPFIIAVDPKRGINNLGDLLALARKTPGEVLYGTIRESAPHLIMEALQARAGIKMTLVPYQATTRALGDVLGGRLAIIVNSLSELAGPVRSGQLKALAVTSAKRLPDYPDLPTVAETFSGFEGNGWFALTAPAGIPDAVLATVNEGLRSVLAQDDVKAKFATLGTYARPMSAVKVAQFIQHERDTWSPVVRQVELLAH